MNPKAIPDYEKFRKMQAEAREQLRIERATYTPRIFTNGE